MRTLRIAYFAASALFLTAAAWGADPAPVRILVAASAKDAVGEIGEAFEKKTGSKVTVIGGASNTLAAQILQDAPADLFLSADLSWAEKVKAEGYTDQVHSLLSNGLVVVVPKGNPAGIHEPKDLLKPGVKRLAMAGEKVPAGKYGQQALEAQKIYQELSDNKKIVRGADVRATLTYVEIGEVEAGIVYATDAKISKKVETVFVFDPKDHDKIVYGLVLLKKGKQNPSAVQFLEYLESDKAREAFEKFGFSRTK